MTTAALPLALLSLAPLVCLAEEIPSPVSVIWSEEVDSPAVCVEKDSWFVSVVPKRIQIDTLESAALRGPEGEVAARILHLDPEQRLCLLEAAATLGPVQPFSLSADAAPKAGERAECVSGKTACRTTVAGKDWSYRGERFPLPLLRLRVSDVESHCRPGTPLVDEKGLLLGILTCHRPEASDEVYAIPAARIRKLVEDVKRHKRSGPVWIGLVLHNESSTPEVLEVKPGSPAEKAGLLPGDVILGMGDAEIESFDDLVEAIHNLPAGEETHVRILRGLGEETFAMTPRFAEMASAAR